MTKLLVATTIASWKCDGRQEIAWLDEAEEMADFTGAHFFAALEVDGRGESPYQRALYPRMRMLLDNTTTQCDHWRFAVDDQTNTLTSGDRLIRICMGRNMAHEYAMRNGYTHILFADSDIRIPGDGPEKLLEIDHPVVGGHVPIYALDGPRLQLEVGPDIDVLRRIPREREAFPAGEAGFEEFMTEQTFCKNFLFEGIPDGWPEADVREHWNTAGFLLVRRDVFTSVAWHYNLDLGQTDDPAFQAAVERAGFGRTWVRHDVTADHEPIPMVAIEERGSDLKHVPW